MELGPITSRTANRLIASNVAGPAILNEAASSTNPTIIPNKADLTTGIGWAASALHFIVGGTSYANLSTTALTISGNLSCTTITGGAWNGSVIGPAYGGTGIANNAASTLTISGNYATTLTISGITALTLPTTGTLATLAGTEELDNKTLDSSVAKGTWTVSGTWTIPAVTLGGIVTGNGQAIIGVGEIGTNNLYQATDSNLLIRLDSGAAGTRKLNIATRNAANNADVVRLSFNHIVDTAVATWSNITHTELVITDGAYVQLGKTDTDGTVEGQIWYDASEDKLKFKTAAGVETITSA